MGKTIFPIILRKSQEESKSHLCVNIDLAAGLPSVAEFKMVSLPFAARSAVTDSAAVKFDLLAALPSGGIFKAVVLCFLGEPPPTDSGGTGSGRRG